MSQVITFENYRPPARFDDLAWTEAEIYEAATADGSGTLIDTITLDPVDADPSEPAYRDFTTENASSTAALWYWIVFKDADGDSSQPTDPVQNTRVAYADVDELARILKLRDPSDAQQASMARVLEVAAGEINAEIGLVDSELSGWQLHLAAEVNLERAVEHWRQMEAPFGLIGIGTEFGGGAERVARDSWDRHAHKLAPLKESWGIA